MNKSEILVKIDKFVYRSDLERTLLADFPSKSLNYTPLNLFLQKLSTLAIEKITISAITDITMEASVKKWEQLRCVVHSPLIVGMTIALLVSLGTCFVRTQSVRVKFACAKRPFNFSAEAIIIVRNARLSSQVHNIPFEDQKSSFFLSLAQEVYVSEESPKSIQDLLEMPTVLANFVSTGRNANLLTVTQQLRDQFLIVEILEPDFLFTNFRLRYKST